jgi:hypothetical protein
MWQALQNCFEQKDDKNAILFSKIKQNRSLKEVLCKKLCRKNRNNIFAN